VQLEASFICDDIRSEVGHKVSLMGIYDEKILLVQLPVRIAKLCLFQRWSQVPRGAKVAVEVRGTAMVTPVRLEPQEMEDSDQSTSIGKPKLVIAKVQIAICPIDLSAEGNLEFLTYWEGSATPQHSHIIQVGRLTKEEALKIGIR
jgi:hypothetical protein